MTRLIDADELDRAMYHKSFETDDGRQKWNSGLWIRYKIYEEAVNDAPTIDAVPVEWIETYINTRVCNSYDRVVLMDMLSKWNYHRSKAEREED